MDNIQTAFLPLLESTLETYAVLCARKGARKSDLDRHEAIIKTAFNQAGGLLQLYRYNSTMFGAYSDGILKNALREGLEFAVARFLLNHRYPKP